MMLKTADARGVFLQGKKIERELYFRVPRGLDPCTMPGLEPGCLLHLNKSISGRNDAVRAWYLRFFESLDG